MTENTKPKILVIGNPTKAALEAIEMHRERGHEIVHVESVDELPAGVKPKLPTMKIEPIEAIELMKVNRIEEIYPQKPSKYQNAKKRRQGARHY